MINMAKNDERLIFEVLNEPRQKGVANEWCITYDFGGERKGNT